MLFNSAEYIFYFLPATLVVYFLLQRIATGTIARLWLVGCSLFFYGWWRPEYLVLILLSIIFNFYVGRFIVSHSDRAIAKRALIVGIVFNISLLAYFKYANFAVEIFGSVVNYSFEPLDIILPLAISFFTFQQIAYLADCYSDHSGRYHFLDYVLFVCFFPQLIAGPIVHHKEMMPQFTSVSHRKLNLRNVALGAFIFNMGLFKKLVIADTFAIWANAGFDSQIELQLLDAWLVSLSYTFQLYYDFSAYTDMAIGAALLFNIRLPINFNSPYKASDIQDFWRRWHMTLSRWLRDYVYIPLGGNRTGPSLTLANLFLTFLIGGIWHGAGWTFVLWGALHGIATCVHRLWTKAGLQMSRSLGLACTFLFVHVAWVFFRAENVTDAFRVLRGMAGLNGLALSNEFVEFFQITTGFSYGAFDGNPMEFATTPMTLLYIGVFGTICFVARNSIELARFADQKAFPIPARWGVATGLSVWVVVLLAIGDSVPSEFLYFNF